ncbi:hypothetical protein DL96DRAFT_1628559 [Flagelloscypha sp. PMI_526]|nr:hypothetical protein DL96DRAFT_1628559 [Flagelloscypha sp. PMI_526]
MRSSITLSAVLVGVSVVAPIVAAPIEQRASDCDVLRTLLPTAFSACQASSSSTRSLETRQAQLLGPLIEGGLGIFSNLLGGILGGGGQQGQQGQQGGQQGGQQQGGGGGGLLGGLLGGLFGKRDDVPDVSNMSDDQKKAMSAVLMSLAKLGATAPGAQVPSADGKDKRQAQLLGPLIQGGLGIFDNLLGGLFGQGGQQGGGGGLGGLLGGLFGKRDGAPDVSNMTDSQKKAMSAVLMSLAKLGQTAQPKDGQASQPKDGADVEKRGDVPDMTDEQKDAMKDVLMSIAMLGATAQGQNQTESAAPATGDKDKRQLDLSSLGGLIQGGLGLASQFLGGGGLGGLLGGLFGKRDDLPPMSDEQKEAMKDVLASLAMLGKTAQPRSIADLD